MRLPFASLSEGVEEVGEDEVEAVSDGKPGEFVGCEPAEALAFVEDDVVGVAVERHEEDVLEAVGEVVHPVEGATGDVGFDLLEHLSDDAGFRRFVRFDVAAGEVPHVRV